VEQVQYQKDTQFLKRKCNIFKVVSYKKEDMTIKTTLPTNPIVNFHDWLKFIKKSVTNTPLQDSEIERPLTFNKEFASEVIDKKSARN